MILKPGSHRCLALARTLAVATGTLRNMAAVAAAVSGPVVVAVTATACGSAGGRSDSRRGCDLPGQAGGRSAGTRPKFRNRRQKWPGAQ